jgi:hypothetical protein
MIGSTISRCLIVVKLGRTVALKYSDAHLLNDPRTTERFLFDAKAATALL